MARKRDKWDKVVDMVKEWEDYDIGDSWMLAEGLFNCYSRQTCKVDCPSCVAHDPSLLPFGDEVRDIFGRSIGDFLNGKGFVRNYAAIGAAIRPHLDKFAEAQRLYERKRKEEAARRVAEEDAKDV